MDDYLLTKILLLSKNFTDNSRISVTIIYFIAIPELYFIGPDQTMEYKGISIITARNAFASQQTFPIAVLFE